MKTLVRSSWFLPLISGGVALTCLVYCRIWWIPHPMTITDPDESFLCWMFCKTLSNVWFSLGVTASLLSIAGGAMIRRNMSGGKALTVISGALLLPVGLLNFIPLYAGTSIEVEPR